MKFTLNRADALATCTQALKTCDTKTKEVGSDADFLFTVKAGAIRVTSNCGIASQHVPLPAFVEDEEAEAEFLVPAAAITEFFKQFDSEAVACELKETHNLLVVGSEDKASQFAFPTLSPENYAPMRGNIGPKSFVLDGPTLAKALSLTLVAASTNIHDTPRCAVHIVLDGDTLLVEAQDGQRMARYETASTHSFASRNEILIPRQVAEILAASLEKADEVTLGLGQAHVRVTWGENEMIASLEAPLGDPFPPDLVRFFREEPEATVVISRNDLLRKLKLAGLIAKGTYILVTTTESGLTISANEMDKGASRDNVIAQTVVGESETTVGCMLLTKAVDSIESPWVEITFRKLPNGFTALVLKDGEYEHLVCPVTANDDLGEEFEDEDGGEDTDE